MSDISILHRKSVSIRASMLRILFSDEKIVFHRDQVMGLRLLSWCLAELGKAS